ncbi:MAG: MIP/aquaporin family protein [Acidobacteriota bacterium]
MTRRSAVEALGTAFLLASVVGSGIMAERLAGGNAALALLANSLATGAGLIALILAFEPYSGAHLNPLVTVTDAILGRRPWRDVWVYVAAQTAGAFAGVALANAMFGEPLLALSRHVRAGAPQVLGELIATFGLLAIIFVSPRRSAGRMAVAIGGYVAAAYWFTSSTCFANPAVTLARAVTDTFTGIRPTDVPGFIAGQFLGFVAVVGLLKWLIPRRV